MSQVSSIFSQILRQVPRVVFDDAVTKHNAERQAQGYRIRLARHLGIGVFKDSEFVAAIGGFLAIGEANPIAMLRRGRRLRDHAHTRAGPCQNFGSGRNNEVRLNGNLHGVTFEDTRRNQRDACRAAYAESGAAKWRRPTATSRNWQPRLSEDGLATRRQ
jgi:hypothetical protein